MKNTKKNSVMKKILPSACMLAVSAAMLSTSTYAWFTMSDTVTVTGMKLRARGEGGIVIGRMANTSNDTRAEGLKDITVNLNTGADMQLLPTSTADTTAWYHASAASADAHTAKSGTLAALTLTDTAPAASALGDLSDSSSNKYVLYDTFTVWPDKNSNTYTDLYVSKCYIDGTSTADLSKSVRVAFVATGGSTIICAPKRTSDDTTNLTYSVGTTPTNVTALGTSGTSSTGLTKADTNTLKEGAIGTSGQEVKVYLWFEGEDNDHTTNNLDNNGREDISINFELRCSSLTAEPAAQGG